MQFDCDWPDASTIVQLKRQARARGPKKKSSPPRMVPLRPAVGGIEISSTQLQGHITNTKNARTVRKPIGGRSLSAIPRTLSLAGARCANSVLLSAHDRVLLEHFPATTVYHHHSVGSWCPLTHVHYAKAASSSMVMHMVLATAASDMRRKSLPAGSVPAPCLGDIALYHYTSALHELQRSITPDRSPHDDQSLDAIMATLFLMIHYGLSSNSTVLDAKMHFLGLKSLMVTYLQSSELTGTKARAADGLPPLTSQLLIWLLYSDAGGSCSGYFSELINVFSDPSLRRLNTKQLYEDSYRAFPRPRLGADVRGPSKHSRFFELADHTQGIRARIWKASSTADSDERSQLFIDLMEKLKSYREQYDDVFMSVYSDNSRKTISKYSINLTLMILTHYWSCVLFCRRWLVPSRPREPAHRNAIFRIVQVLRYLYTQNKRRSVRCPWPLFLVSVETEDSAERQWALDRLLEIRDASAECEWSWKTAVEVTTRQDLAGDGVVDLAQFMYIMPVG